MSTPRSATMGEEGACREVRFECRGREVAIFMATETVAAGDGTREVIKSRVEIGPLDIAFRMEPQTARRLADCLRELARD